MCSRQAWAKAASTCTGGREAEHPGPVHVPRLVGQVQAERARPLRRLQVGAADDGPADAGHALHAFVGGDGDGGDAQGRRVDLHRAEGGDGVHQQPDAAFDRHNAATSSRGFRMPVLVSQCTMNTWLIAGIRLQHGGELRRRGRA